MMCCQSQLPPREKEQTKLSLHLVALQSQTSLRLTLATCQKMRTTFAFQRPSEGQISWTRGNLCFCRRKESVREHPKRNCPTPLTQIFVWASMRNIWQKF